MKSFIQYVESVHHFDAGKEVRAIARERIGQPPRRQVIRSKKDKPPKHKERHDY
jgi:hypothetical protein